MAAVSPWSTSVSATTKAARVAVSAWTAPVTATTRTPTPIRVIDRWNGTELVRVTIEQGGWGR